jgi:hypothetical protein
MLDINLKTKLKNSSPSVTFNTLLYIYHAVYIFIHLCTYYLLQEKFSHTKCQATVKPDEKTVFNEEKRSKPADYQSERIFAKGFSWTI